MIESKMNRDIKVLLNRNSHAYFYKASDRFNAGVPDIIGTIDGRCVVIEGKIGTRKVTPLQAHTMKKYNDAGAAVYVLRRGEDIEGKCCYIIKIWDWTVDSGISHVCSTLLEVAEWILKRHCSSIKEES